MIDYQSEAALPWVLCPRGHSTQVVYKGKPGHAVLRCEHCEQYYDAIWMYHGDTNEIRWDLAETTPPPNVQSRTLTNRRDLETWGRESSQAVVYWTVMNDILEMLNKGLFKTARANLDLFIDQEKSRMESEEEKP